MNPKTGAVYAMASSPTFNANLLLKPGGQAKVAKISGAERLRPRHGGAEPDDPGPLSAGLDVQDAHGVGRARHRQGHADHRSSTTPATASSTASRSTTPATRTRRRQPRVRQRHVLARRSSTRSTPSSATSARQLGAAKILDYAKRYGFYSSPPLDTPPSTIAPSGLYKYNKETGRSYLWFPSDPATQVDPGRLAFGQERMLVTPLQMALVASTIANHGREPVPYLVKKVTAPNGSVISRTKPGTLGRPISPKTAAELNQMMQLVVQGGTGTRGADSPGVAVAGKTGTAELGLGQHLRLVVRLPSRRRATRSTPSRSSSRSSRTASAATIRGADREGHPRKPPARLIGSLGFT